MLSINEEKIRTLCGSSALAEQILKIVELDERLRREELVARQTEGLRKAREMGTQLGRPPIKRPRKFHAIYESFLKNELSARSASQALGVSPGTFKRWVAEHQSAE